MTVTPDGPGPRARRSIHRGSFSSRIIFAPGGLRAGALVISLRLNVCDVGT